MYLEENNTLVLLIKLFKFTNKNEKRKFFSLIFHSLMVSLLETSVILVLAPFLSLLVNPSYKVSNNYISNFLNSNFDSNHIYILGSFLVVLTFLSALMRTTYIYNERNFASKLGTKLSIKAYSNVIHQPLEYHIDSRSSNIISNLTYVNLLITGVLQPVFQIISTSILALGIITTILFIYPTESFFMIGILISLYSSLSFLFRKKIKRASNLADSYTKSLLKLQSESLKSIKDIIIGNFYKYFENKYFLIDKPLRKLGVQISIMSTAPRYVIESFAIALIALTGMYFVSISKNSEVLVILGVLALAFQRLLPTVQQFYGSIVTLGSNKYCLAGILELLNNYIEINNNNEKLEAYKAVKISRINLENITYRYQDRTLAINGIDLSITQGQKIGIIGATGGGKSTLLNIILGLISPTSGKITFNDNCALEDNLLRNWHNQLSHVPQTIFLNDASISENIAFGIDKELISKRNIINASKDAQIHNYINSLPNGYNTVIGEGGVKLSGGQRQRIGIARALYNKKNYLILDEATNALDALTENRLIERLLLNKRLTLIAICHRISVFKNFDKIIILEKGKIIDIGTFDELENNSEIFKRLLKLDQF